MTISRRVVGVGALTVALVTSCVSDGSPSSDDSDEQADPAPGVSVAIPPERLTPFCQAMTDLTDRVRSGDEVGDDLIIETYRSISDDVPAAIAADFALVLQALETGNPAPTDPPRATLQTLPRPETTPPSTEESVAATVPASDPSVAPATSDPSSTLPGSVVVDERFDRDDTPADRINSYVSFTCRSADNNPGPQATQPLEGPPPSDGN